MKYTQELLEKGHAEGEARKRGEIIEGLLRVEVARDVIKAATGLTEAGF